MFVKIYYAGQKERIRYIETYGASHNVRLLEICCMEPLEHNRAGRDDGLHLSEIGHGSKNRIHKPLAWYCAATCHGCCTITHQAPNMALERW